jgi:hypothetical protein
MTTKEFARRTQRMSHVVAVAAVLAFVGGTVTVGAHDKDRDKARDNKVRHDKDRQEKARKEAKERLDKLRKMWRKINMCHVDRDGRARLIEISEEAESTHRAHGDGRPGDRIGKFVRRLWNRDCSEVPEPPAPPAPAPAPAPLPPADPLLACPCWNTLKQAELLAVLSPNSSPAENYCLVSPTTVSLSPDLGVNTLVFASNSCILRVNGADVASLFGLSEPEVASCVSEATALVPSISWCPK